MFLLPVLGLGCIESRALSSFLTTCWADSDAETEILDFLYVYNISDISSYVIKTIYHCSLSME